MRKDKIAKSKLGCNFFCTKCGTGWSSSKPNYSCPECKLIDIKKLIDEAKDWQECCCKIYDTVCDENEEKDNDEF